MLILAVMQDMCHCPFKQNIWAEVLEGEWTTTGPERLVPFHLQKRMTIFNSQNTHCIAKPHSSLLLHMDVQAALINLLLTIHESCTVKCFFHVEQRGTGGHWEWVGKVNWNNGNRTNPTVKSAPPQKVGRLLKLFHLNRAIPFSFRLHFPKMLAEWIRPLV